MTTITQECIRSLQRIADREARADRRHRGMVDLSELHDMQRIARRSIQHIEEMEAVTCRTQSTDN